MIRKSVMPKPRFLPRIRVMCDETIILGPGKADLLEAIRRTGTIRDAAAQLGMSYMRAWGLVRTMNDSFLEPLVTATRGGSEKGHAVLTDTGIQALKIYREMERAAGKAAASAFAKLRKLARR
jgi:molybdate transport system regulatory protein